MGFLKRAEKSGQIHAALYELTDAELVKSLVAVGAKLNIVLADIVSKQAFPKKEAAAKKGRRFPRASKQPGVTQENKDAFEAIQHSAQKGSLLYRLPPSGHIVHNKFLIHSDSKGRPQAVLTGSSYSAVTMTSVSYSVTTV